MPLVWIALGGALGALSRYGVHVAFGRTEAGQTFPLATLTVNLLGCFLIGAVSAYLARNLEGESARALQMFLCVGFLGSLTTFSTFAFQTQELFTTSFWLAALNIGLSVVLGLVCVVLGSASVGLITKA